MAGPAEGPGGRRVARLVQQLLSPEGAAADPAIHFPASGDGPWEAVDSAAEGWAADGLERLCQLAEEAGTAGLMVTHRGRIVLERYWGGVGRTDTFDVASIQKSVIALLLGVAWDRRMFSLSDPVSKYVPAWTRGPPSGAAAGDEVEEEGITVEHLLTMTTGLDTGSGEAPGPGGGVTRSRRAGERWLYNTVAYLTGTHCLLSALAGTTLQRLTHDWLLGPLGCSSSRWRVRTGRRGGLLRNGDSRLLPHTSGLFSCPRDLSRIGILLLSRGLWRGRRVVSGAWLDALARPCGPNPAYGYLWWLNGQHSAVRLGGASPEPLPTPRGLLPHAPRDTLMAHGQGGQKLYVSRRTGLVVVRLAGAAAPAASGAEDAPLDDLLWEHLMAACPDTLRRAAGLGGDGGP